jgi:psiF repeat
MMLKLVAGVILVPLLTVTVAAQTPVPAGGKAMTHTAAAAMTHSPESIECSKQADAKGLHGKPRKTFRATCKKELKKKT